jgi:hypothetical protein
MVCFAVRVHCLSTGTTAGRSDHGVLWDKGLVDISRDYSREKWSLCDLRQMIRIIRGTMSEGSDHGVFWGKDLVDIWRHYRREKWSLCDLRQMIRISRGTMSEGSDHGVFWGKDLVDIWRHYRREEVIMVWSEVRVQWITGGTTAGRKWSWCAEVRVQWITGGIIGGRKWSWCALSGYLERLNPGEVIMLRSELGSSDQSVMDRQERI